MTVDRMLKKAPMARMKVVTPYFLFRWGIGCLYVRCIDACIGCLYVCTGATFDLIIGNMRGASNPNDPYPN